MSYSCDASNCPTCLRPPHKWIESARYNSGQMFWIGCEKCGILAGGKSVAIASTNWNRQVVRVKYQASFR